MNTPAGLQAWSAAYNNAIVRSYAETANANTAVIADTRRDAERKAKRKREKAARKKSWW